MSMGDRLKKLIKDAGMTQAEFAEKNNFSKDTVVKHCNGQNMNVDSLKEYAKVLNVSTDYLVFGEEKIIEQEEVHYENRVPLKIINEAIMLLMNFFGNDCVMVCDDNGDGRQKYISISINNNQMAQIVEGIKSMRELIDNPQYLNVKTNLEKTLVEMITAEGVIAEISSINGEVYIYNPQVEEIVDFGWDEFNHHFAVMPRQEFLEHMVKHCDEVQK